MSHIYICSPSAPFDKEKHNIENGLNLLTKLGFEVTFSKYCFDNYGNTSSSIKNRVSDLMEGFTNPKYDLFLASRGGTNSNEILPYLDYDLISKNSKIFCGFSDMTTLTTNLYQKSNIKTIYGYNFSVICKLQKTKDLEQWFGLIKNPNNFTGFKKNKTTDVFRKGKASGRLVGGNLAVLYWLLGTPFSSEIRKGDILFLEDDLETNSYYWQMYLTHLKQTGVFEKINGLIFGQVLPDTEFAKNQTFEQILTTVIGEYDFPVLKNANFGHIENPINIPLGSFYDMDL